MNSLIPVQRDANADDGSMELSLEDTLTPRRGGLPFKAAGGYNPYDTVPLDESRDRDRNKLRKQADLRKLSEWIRLTLEIDELKKGKP
jgi:hypothetical protein